jgi:hypothetical protein
MYLLRHLYTLLCDTYVQGSITFGSVITYGESNQNSSPPDLELVYLVSSQATIQHSQFERYQGRQGSHKPLR